VPEPLSALLSNRPGNYACPHCGTLNPRDNFHRVQLAPEIERNGVASTDVLWVDRCRACERFVIEHFICTSSMIAEEPGQPGTMKTLEERLVARLHPPAGAPGETHG